MPNSIMAKPTLVLKDLDAKFGICANNGEGRVSVIEHGCTGVVLLKFETLVYVSSVVEISGCEIRNLCTQ